MEELKTLKSGQVFFSHQYVSLTCYVWGEVVQLDCQGKVSVFEVVQGVAVSSGTIKEPLPTKHRSVRQVQPQVLSHLTLLTFPATERREGTGGKHSDVINMLINIHSHITC